MGANAQTAVPVFTAGQVLTAQQQTEINTGIPVFATTVTRDAAFGGAGEKTLAEGQFAYIEATNATQYYDGAAWQSVGVAPGLVLISTTTFSAAATHTVNDVFSATYDNYKILLTCTSQTGSVGNILMRMRVGGADNTNNEYTRNKFYFTTANATGSDSGSTGTSSFLIGEDETNSFSSIELYAPFLTQKTKHNIQTAKQANGIIYSGTMTVTTSYTGFTLLLSSATNFTGSVSVYGYAK